MNQQRTRTHDAFDTAGCDPQPVLAELTEQAARCRRLAATTHDRDVAGMLAAMAADYERAADALLRN